mmetsp:Transcript_3928/g.7938  ORF Transcript_3928/g.7938 Transcript_3928/m.7938 type:complete len:84 (-) Transcript_3928:61-312(-)
MLYDILWMLYDMTLFVPPESWLEPRSCFYTANSNTRSRTRNSGARGTEKAVSRVRFLVGQGCGMSAEVWGCLVVVVGHCDVVG